jgi:hypothetical protein
LLKIKTVTKMFVEACGAALWGAAAQVRSCPDALIKFPVRSKSFPALRKTFPVPLRREFWRKLLNSLGDWARKDSERAKF